MKVRCSSIVVGGTSSLKLLIESSMKVEIFFASSF